MKPLFESTQEMARRLVDSLGSDLSGSPIKEKVHNVKSARWPYLGRNPALPEIKFQTLE